MTYCYLNKLLISYLIFVCSVKRDCFDWWCFDDKATETPPTRAPTIPSTTPPMTTTTTTHPPATAQPPSAPDLDQAWQDFLDGLFGSGGIFGK